MKRFAKIGITLLSALFVTSALASGSYYGPPKKDVQVSSKSPQTQYLTIVNNTGYSYSVDYSFLPTGQANSNVPLAPQSYYPNNILTLYINPPDTLACYNIKFNGVTIPNGSGCAPYGQVTINPSLSKKPTVTVSH